MGRIVQWDTVTLSREKAQAAWLSLVARNPMLASHVRKDFDEQAGYWVHVEVPRGDGEKVRLAARKAVQS